LLAAGGVHPEWEVLLVDLVVEEQEIMEELGEMQLEIPDLVGVVERILLAVLVVQEELLLLI
jgi:hypothetical protein